MWLYFQKLQHENELSASFVKSSPSRPNYETIQASWNYDNQRETHVTQLRVFAFRCEESRWGKEKEDGSPLLKLWLCCDIVL